ARHTRGDMGFVNPPLALVSCGQSFRFSALNQRGQVLLPRVAAVVRTLDAVAWAELQAEELSGAIKPVSGRFPEEQRSKQPSVFSLLRTLVELFYSAEDQHLGLYGAFGYDLAFQFEPLRLRLDRPPDHRDLLPYLPAD